MSHCGFSFCLFVPKKQMLICKQASGKLNKEQVKH